MPGHLAGKNIRVEVINLKKEGIVLDHIIGKGGLPLFIVRLDSGEVIENVKRQFLKTL